MNEALQSAGAPLKVLSGYIGHVTVSVPWSALLKENCKVEISELALSVAPHTPPHQTDEQGEHVIVHYVPKCPRQAPMYTGSV